MRFAFFFLPLIFCAFLFLLCWWGRHFFAHFHLSPQWPIFRVCILSHKTMTHKNARAHTHTHTYIHTDTSTHIISLSNKNHCGLALKIRPRNRTLSLHWKERVSAISHANCKHLEKFQLIAHFIFDVNMDKCILVRRVCSADRIFPLYLKVRTLPDVCSKWNSSCSFWLCRHQKDFVSLDFKLE